MGIILDIAGETWVVAGQMSPYLLFGFLVAGALSAFVSPEWFERHLGGRGFTPVFKSVLLGVPLPLCSCGVIAVTASIRARGASRAAATGFLLSTPQTGVDSILATWGMLGPLMGMFRPVIALVSGLLGGALVMLFGEPEETRRPPGTEKTACCSDGCHDADDPAPTGAWSKTLRALHYGLVTLPADIARPLVVGMVIAGAVSALAPPGMLGPSLGTGLPAMIAMILIGVPLYVCATASIPLAVGFMHLGVSPGAALAFLIAGPATNAATLATVWKMMGRRTALLYLAAVVLTALGAGLGFDALSLSFAGGSLDPAHALHGEQAEGGPLWAALLAAVLVWSVLEPRMRQSAKKVPAAASMVTLRVGGMTCSHCANAVARALRDAAGNADVSVDLAAGCATVTGGNLSAETLAQAVARLGYDVRVSE